MQGLGGVGKTVLAQALARDPAVQRRYPDGVLWVTMTEVRDGVAALGVARRWGENRLGLGDMSRVNHADEVRARVRTALAEARYPIVLDDVWQIDAARDLAGLRGDGCGLLATTRKENVARQLAPPHSTVRVSEMEPAQALQLFVETRGQPVAPHERAAVDELLERLVFHPLGIHVVATQLRGDFYGLGDFLQPLAERQGASFERLREQEAARKEEVAAPRPPR